MKKIITILYTLYCILYTRVPTVHATVTASCQALIISPSKAAYAPGETIQIEAQGTGVVQEITLAYVKTDPNLTSTTPLFWRWDELHGEYNATSQSWQGTLTLPEKDGEYVIAPNIKDSSGNICSGNPGYSCAGCQSGTEAKTDAAGNVVEVGKTACQGCHKVVVVDSNYGRTTGYDMKKYWNMSSGYSWNYVGENNYSGTGESFETRFSIEEKVNACGHIVLPWRFTKSNLSGYWMPKTPSVGVSGDVNLRFLLTYFQPGESWSQNTLGSLYHKIYSFPSTSSNPITELGRICPNCNVNVRMFDTQSYAFNYFAPYLYAPNLFVPANYDFERIDVIYDVRNEEACSTSYSPTNHNKYWHTSYLPDFVDTPAYKGPALRLWQIEAGLNPGSTKPEEGFSWMTREDWYLAEGIGIVQIDEYGGWCSGHVTECLRKDKPLAKPPVQLKLTSAYTGQSLVVSAPTQVESRGSYTLHVSNNYTGYLEAKACVSESSCTPAQSFKWSNCDGTPIWVNHGLAQADLSTCPNLPKGLHHSYFRPWIDTVPKDTQNETVLTKTELPWSNEVLIRVGNALLPGDLDGDGHVNLADYQLLLAYFGNPYTIFDYSQLVENFGL